MCVCVGLLITRLRCIGQVASRCRNLLSLCTKRHFVSPVCSCRADFLLGTRDHMVYGYNEATPSRLPSRVRGPTRLLAVYGSAPCLRSREEFMSSSCHDSRFRDVNPCSRFQDFENSRFPLLHTNTHDFTNSRFQEFPHYSRVTCPRLTMANTT